jgi:hypothetical protein
VSAKSGAEFPSRSCRLIPDDLARLIASGQVDPYSYEPFEEDTAPKPAPMPAPSATHHESDSGAHLGTSHEPCDEDALTMRASRSRASLCASSGSSGRYAPRHPIRFPGISLPTVPTRSLSLSRNALGRVPSFGGGRSKMPLLLPQRNSISSYFSSCHPSPLQHHTHTRERERSTPRLLTPCCLIF